MMDLEPKPVWGLHNSTAPRYCTFCSMTITGANANPCANSHSAAHCINLVKTAPLPPKTPREVLLAEALKIVTKDRNSTYGNPENNFQQIAELWKAYKGVEFSAIDVALMSALIKFARLSVTPAHWDSLVDIAGYAACGADCQQDSKATDTACGVNKKL